MFDWDQESEEFLKRLWDDRNEDEKLILPYDEGNGENNLFSLQDCSNIYEERETGNQWEFYESNNNKKSTNVSKEISSSPANLDLQHGFFSLNPMHTCEEIDGIATMDILNAEEYDSSLINGKDMFLSEEDSINGFADLEGIFRSYDLAADHEWVVNENGIWSSLTNVIISPPQSNPVVSNSLSVASSSQNPEVVDFVPEIIYSNIFSPQKNSLHNKDATLDTGCSLLNQEKNPNEMDIYLLHEPHESSIIRQSSDNKEKAIFFKMNKNKVEEFESKDIQNQWPHRIDQNPQLEKTCQAVPISEMHPPVESTRNLESCGLSSYLGKNNSSMPEYGYSQSQFPLVPDGNNTDFSCSVGSQSMTPQDKMKKLRRLQQMQAMAAIQKQQQLQFRHQTPHSDRYSTSHTYKLTNQVPDDENNNKMGERNYSCHLSKPSQHSTASEVSVDDDGFIESTIISQLQDVIQKLDSSTRLCIRDSLFRLAKSAKERCHMNDSGSKSTIVDKHKRENSGVGKHKRCFEKETSTNPIDRAVAGLLFHRPLGNICRSY